MINRRKKKKSVLVGGEADDAQEQIVSSALQRVVENKGKNFRLKSATGGGFKGESEEIVIGKKAEKIAILPIEVFTEIKKSLVLSKKKMEEICNILRIFKVKMTPNVREKLKDIDHLLDKEYETIRIKVKETETVEVEEAEKNKSGKKKQKTGKVKNEMKLLRLKKM